MVSRTVSELLAENVTLSIEGLDRLYLNGYVPLLQSEGGVAYYFRNLCHKPSLWVYFFVKTNRAVLQKKTVLLSQILWFNFELSFG